MTWLRHITRQTSRARYVALELGHRLGRLDAGDNVAITSCANLGCSVMLEVDPAGTWRLIDLADDTRLDALLEVGHHVADERPPCRGAR